MKCDAMESRRKCNIRLCYNAANACPIQIARKNMPGSDSSGIKVVLRFVRDLEWRCQKYK